MTTTRTSGAGEWSPPVLGLGWVRYRLELKTFLRNREEVVFTLAFPLILLLLFGVGLNGEIESTGVDFVQYFLAGMIASSAVSAGFISLSQQVAIEQHDGTLKRLAGTPMSPVSYFIGKTGVVITAAAAQMVLLFVIGGLFYGVDLPRDAFGWLTMGWVMVLGLAASSFLGISITRMVDDPRAAAAVAQPPALVLQFISGVFFLFSGLPVWLQNVASLFPLRWMTLGLRSVLLPDGFKAAETAGDWQRTKVFVVLAIWTLGAGILARRTFRWSSRDE